MRVALVFLLCAAAAAPPLAQPLPFGAGESVMERGASDAGGLHLDAFAGPAYLDGWRTALHARLRSHAGPLTIGADATLHPGAGGLYRDEADDLDDLLRTVRVRLDPTPARRVYARIGPTERVTLGTGALVRDLSSGAAPDEQPLGAEAAAEIGPAFVAAFATDVTRGGIVGADARLTTAAVLGPLRRLGLGVAAVHDTGPTTLRRLSGAEVSLRGELVGDGETFALAPFAAVAGYAGRGATLGGGIEADAVTDAIGARARAAVFASTARFAPGHVGPFYGVAGGDRRIVVADGFYDADPALPLAGTPLDSLRAGVDVVLDVRAVVFGRAEVSHHLRRHVGPDRASAWGVRLAARIAGDVRAELAVERQGFRGITGLLFGGLGEENRLVLDIGVPVGPVHVLVRSRYGYRRLPAGAAGDAPRYLIERRFEPMVGARLRW